MNVEEKTDVAHVVDVLKQITYFMISPSMNLLLKHMVILTLVSPQHKWWTEPPRQGWIR